MAHAFRISEQVHEVWLSRTPRGYELHMGDSRIEVAMRDRGAHQHELVLGEETVPVFVATHGDNVHIHFRGEAFTLSYSHNLERFASQANEHSEAVSRAPMPGAVISLSARLGQAVTRGDVLVVIESMKMETAIYAAMDGVVQTVHVQQGQTFERDAPLVTLAPAKVTT